MAGFEVVKTRLDRATLAGLLCVVLGILGGFALENGSVSDLVQGTAALIVFGGTIGAVLVSTPSAQVMSAVRAWRQILFEPHYDFEETTEQLITFATKARRRGLISLDEDLGSMEDPILKRTVELAIDGMTSVELRDMMELDIQAEDARAYSLAKVYEAAGGYAPTLGIIGAVLGLIQVMKNLANIDEVGHGIAVAFVATIYGVGAANLIFLPAAAKIRNHAHRRSEFTRLVVEAVSGIAEGMNPRMLRRKLEPLCGNFRSASAETAVNPETAGETIP